MSFKKSESGKRTAWLFEFLATVGFVGRSPWAPGTMGTLVAVPLGYGFLELSPLMQLVIALVFLFFAIFVAEMDERYRGRHDASEVVIDEVAGYLITIALLPNSIWTLIAGFIAFRIFDIWKPYPISRLDQQVPGGFGTVLDDAAAGLIANIILRFIFQAFHVSGDLGI